MLGKQLVYLDTGIYLGNYESCKLLPNIPAIHISDKHGDGCKSEDKFVWLESEKLSDELILIAADKIKSNDEILIHCQAGMNRSPTICFLALRLRGLTTSEAYLLIAKKMLTEYECPVIPAWNYLNLRIIEKYVSSK